MPDINMQVFGEVKRNQLVTEVDIQTQVALDDYQVKLSDIANPTQSQDNVVIDRHGEFLPHWNESLDFDTWVKMSMEVAGKRILMLRGNSNVRGASSISDTFYKGDDFSGDLSAWTVENMDGTIAIDTEQLKINIGTASITWWAGAPNAPYLYVPTPTYDYIAIVKLLSWSPNDSNKAGMVLFDNLDNAVFNTRFKSPTGNYYNVDKVISDTGYETQGTYASTTTPALLRIRKISTTKYYDVSVDGGVNWNNMYSSTELTGTYIGVMAAAWLTTTLECLFDDFRIQKYTATEPSWTADGEEQNIVTALKSLGRAG